MTLGEYDRQQKKEIIESTFSKVKDVIDHNLDINNHEIQLGLERLEEAEFWLERGIYNEENRIN